MKDKRAILIVEDSAFNRSVLRKILAPHYVTLEARNGQEALTCLERHGDKISLILLDIVMPVMDGFAFLAAMKSNAAYASIPVIVATQRDSESDEVAALAHGAADFIAKPYRPQIILHRIANIINLLENAAIVHELRYDQLTGLYSKGYFYQQVREALRWDPKKEFDIICSDIVSFKLINDIFGVPVGDSILRGIAEINTELVKDKGLCSRLNADQFVCMVEHQTYQEGTFRGVSRRINALTHVNNIDIKWGVYHIEDRSLPVEQMCDRALLAARSIKKQYGKYFAVYDDALRNQLLQEQAVTDSMESALNQGQFEIYLQPKYRIKDNSLTGCEALVRWNHPERGIQSPGAFIPLFERNGFITKLDQYVWDKACAVLRRWDQKGYPSLSVSVNVSRADIYNADLPGILTEIVKKYGLSPSRLHLEITESAYTENPRQIIDTVSHLRELGFVIEMDDFGSGYSSLNMLNEMPVDILKLDMKFIQSETAKPVNQGILRFIISLARWMNLSVVAEGVETAEQLERLREIGCDCVQGYYFSRPMPELEFDRLIEAQCPAPGEQLPPARLEAPPEHVLLVVDEDPAYRALVRQIFGRQYNVLEATDAVTALTRVAVCAEHLCAVVLSLTLPGTDGFTVLEMLRREKAVHSFPVLATAPPDPALEAQALARGADDFLSKPHLEQTLQTRLDRAALALLGQRHHEAQEYLPAAFHNLSCGLCIYQIQGDQLVPLFHNAAFYHITRYSHEHIRQTEASPDYPDVHAEDLEPLRRQLKLLIRNGGLLRHSFRIWNEADRAYRWIQLEGVLQPCRDGGALLYGIFSDVNEQKRLEQALTQANERMETIINAIPGGVAVYKVSDIFETVYFSDGVPELSGYTPEEYRSCVNGDAAELTYPADTAMVVDNLRRAIREHTVADFEFRKQHRDGHVVWVHIQARQIGEEDGLPLLQCVFHNITPLKVAQRELNHLVNSIPGGIASYRVEGAQFIPTYFSDGVMTLSGHTRAEYEALVREDALNLIYEADRARVAAAAQVALESGEVLDVSYRIRHKDGTLIWIHLNGRRMGPLAESTRFYAVFTGMPGEPLPRHTVHDTADALLIIDKGNHELLYASETKPLFFKGTPEVGQTCFASLHGKSAPCEFCCLKRFGPDGLAHEVLVPEIDRIYSILTEETVWNGIPAYVQYIRDVTAEVRARQEKERLEQYFQTLLKNLPGGIAVLRIMPDGTMAPEYISEGFAAMCGMTVEQAYSLYQGDVYAGIHPDDVEGCKGKMAQFFQSGAEHFELEARFIRGDGSYFWAKNHLSTQDGPDGIRRFYCIYADITPAVAERERLHRQFEDLIFQHYHTPDPNTLLLSHSNITRDTMLEIWDSTGSDLLDAYGKRRRSFFAGMSTLIPDLVERNAFLDTFLNASALEAFDREDRERLLSCFLKLPAHAQGCYVRFKMNLIKIPETSDIIGIFKMSDITDQVISERILRRLSVTSHDYVVDLNLTEDTYALLSSRENACWVPPARGCHSQRTAFMAQTAVVPRDRDAYLNAMDPAEMLQRLEKRGLYTITYSLEDPTGELRTKSMTVSAIDLRLGRVSLVCTDITESVRAQQSMLNMLSYTFELTGMINVHDRSFIMYTRQMVLENLPPYTSADYHETLRGFIKNHLNQENPSDPFEQLRLETLVARLKESPAGYEFVMPFQSKESESLRYKQINVLWGDRGQGTICIVRADVTETLAAERQAKSELEKALAQAKEANRAKSDFLSAMSHDIRTPMNAIMGMTALAAAHLDQRDRVAECLQKISVSSRHLLTLVNDVLDMSRIEHANVTLNRVRISLPDLMEHLSVIIAPQAKEAALQFSPRMEDIGCTAFYGDTLRLSQILINLLSNAVKFTRSGGQVSFTVAQIPPAGGSGRVRYRFTVADTGIGMEKGFLAQLFQPFARDYGATRIEGTGLGLSIVHGLVTLMGGEISVESQLEKGTTFQVELEFDAAPEEDAPQPQDAADPAERPWSLSGLHFLVAEDNAINAEVLCELLHMEGAHTVVATDGVEAVQAFQAAAPGAYDAILMDIQMPNMNGYEATRAIRALDRPEAQTIPIVALSANAFVHDIQISLEAGMTAHVAKPIDMDVLRTVLRKALRSQDA